MADHADKIVFLEKGVKLAEGTFEQLLETCPPFRKIWEVYRHSELDDNGCEKSIR